MDDFNSSMYWFEKGKQVCKQIEFWKRVAANAKNSRTHSDMLSGRHPENSYLLYVDALQEELGEIIEMYKTTRMNELMAL